MSALKAANISFGERKHCFSFDINSNEIVFLIGRNGEGKSSLLMSIAGLLPLNSGNLIFEGEDISACDEVGRIKHGIRIALEDRQIFPNLTVKENILIGGYQLNKITRNQKYCEIIDLFNDLKIKERNIAKTLSGGQQTQLNIARSLMGDTRLLLLDEPTLGLDPFNVNILTSIISEFSIKNNLSVIIADNNYRLIQNLANRIIKLENGVLTKFTENSNSANGSKLKDFYP